MEPAVRLAAGGVCAAMDASAATSVRATGQRAERTVTGRASVLFQVDRSAVRAKLGGLLVHALARALADLLRQLHAAELRAAHRAEMRQLGAFGRQGFVVERARRHRIEREVELIFPAELEAGLRQR